MAIGERIHFFRTLRGMTQNILVWRWASRRSPLMCALLNTRTGRGRPRQT